MIDYLYAIVDRLPGAWRPPRAGLAGASVVPRRVGDVVAITGALDSVPPANPRTLALHHDVVASTLDAPAAVPFRYGVALARGELGGWLAERQDAVDEALKRVRGCVEMSVKLLRLDCAVGQLTGPGERELRDLAQHLVDRAGMERWRYRPSGSGGNVVASVAFLVPRADLHDFLARIAPIASRAVGVAVVPTGPWPCYSFVPSMESAPLAKLEADPVSLSRRAG